MISSGRIIRLFKQLSLLSALLIAASYTLVAQDASGRVVGTITDRSGAVIPNVHVVVTNAATHVSRETTTDSSGFYQVLAVPIGSYVVSADHAGFNPVTTSSNALEINQSLKIDIRLEVGAKTETVTVIDSAATVETINPTMGSTVSDRSVQDLPLNGRNVLDLALLQPGVLPADNPNNTSASSANTLSASPADETIPTLLFWMAAPITTFWIMVWFITPTQMRCRSLESSPATSLLNTGATAAAL